MEFGTFECEYELATNQDKKDSLKSLNLILLFDLLVHRMNVEKSFKNDKDKSALIKDFNDFISNSSIIKELCVGIESGFTFAKDSRSLYVGKNPRYVDNKDSKKDDEIPLERIKQVREFIDEILPDFIWTDIDYDVKKFPKQYIWYNMNLVYDFLRLVISASKYKFDIFLTTNNEIEVKWRYKKVNIHTKEKRDNAFVFVINPGYFKWRIEKGFENYGNGSGSCMLWGYPVTKKMIDNIKENGIEDIMNTFLNQYIDNMYYITEW